VEPAEEAGEEETKIEVLKTEVTLACFHLV
jgi:hypothetical protein